MSLILFLVLLLCPSILTLNFSSSELKMKYGSQALNALQRLLKFFENDIVDINLDGLYGLRIAQGQLNELQKSLNSAKPSCLTDKNNLIQSLSIQIDRIANQSLTIIAEKDSNYLQQFALLALKPFYTDYSPRSVSPHLIEDGSRNPEFDEDESDRCFSELLGSSETNNLTRCIVSRPCWEFMISPLSTDYRLTHQLLWFLTGKTIGCFDNRPNSVKANENFRRLEDRFCTNIYEDAKSNYETNYNQDLFLEQILLCAIVGYEDFLQLNWFETILQWQDLELGCFNDASDSIGKRHLLVEQEMKSGCLSHKSGLAAGVLSTYLRAFLQC